MAEVSFRLREEDDFVEICIHDLAPPIPKEADLKRLFNLSEFRNCRFIEENILQVIDALPVQASSLVDGPPEVLKKSMAFVIAEKVDAVLEIEVDKYMMKATAHLTSAQGGHNYSREEIVNKLKDVGAVKGINEEAIDKLVEKTERECPGMQITEILAEGVPSGAGIKSSFEYLVTPIQDRVLTPQEREDGMVDMHDLGEIETVDKGDLLMRRITSLPGANGFNIAGDIINSKAPDNTPFDVGEGTSTSLSDANLLIATRAGIPVKSKNGMSVSDVLMLDDVDLAVGNIDYNGTIVVKGNVVGGMLVKATDNVMVNGFVESGLIEAGGNIVVQQGIIGREIEGDSDIDMDHFTSRLIAGKNISARYAQSAFLEANNDVNINSQLLHCHVIAGDSVYVGKEGQRRSKLVGGHIKASKTVAAGEIGSPANTRVLIDFSPSLDKLHSELRQVVDEKMVKDELFDGLEEALGKLKKQTPTPKLVCHCRKIINTIDKVSRELHANNLNEEGLRTKIEKLRKGIRVKAFGHLYPGVDFLTCDETYHNNDERGNCIIRFVDNRMIFE